MSCCSEDDLKEMEEIGVYNKSAFVQAVTAFICFGVFFLLIFGLLAIGR
jgi:hypothetical protein